MLAPLKPGGTTLRAAAAPAPTTPKSALTAALRALEAAGSKPIPASATSVGLAANSCGTSVAF